MPLAGASVETAREPGGQQKTDQPVAHAPGPGVRLAALHQLRGRVGRGSVSGTCLVMTHSKGNGGASAAQDRLQSLEKTSDGFTLAQMDLRLRHEGEILGYRQHGGVTLRFVDLDADEDLIEWAHLDAVELLRYACNLDSVATRPLRDAVAMRYRHIFKEVSGG